MNRDAVPRLAGMISIVAVVLAACIGAAPSVTTSPPPSAVGSASAPASAPELGSPAPVPTSAASSGAGVGAAGSGVVGPAATIVVPRSTPQATPRTTPHPAPLQTPRPTPLPIPTMPPVPFTGSGVVGRALLGPICPVERYPPDPACADRPVVGAVMVLQNAAGVEVARGITDAQGFFAIPVAAGDYMLVAQPIPNAMHAPGPMSISVPAAKALVVNVSYDTGIR